MKKVYFLFLLLSFSILYGCKTRAKDVDNIINQQDSTLKKLVIKQGTTILGEFNKPVEKKVSAILSSTVNASNSIIIE